MATNRRDRFRAYMAKLAPAAHPRHAIAEGLYVPRPGRSVADQVASRLELEPSSSHLLVGGVGSGKTTQLIVAEKLLGKPSDMIAFYIDVAEKHDLARLKTGVLLVLAGLRLGMLVKDTTDDDVKAARRRFKQWAEGWVEWVEEPSYDWGPDDEEPDHRAPVRHKGVLVPPEPPLDWDTEKKVEQLRVLQQAAAHKMRHIVLIFDSLDRLTSVAPFADLVGQDINAIRSVGIGLVVVGPLSLMFGTGRPIADRFSYFYHQPSVDVAQDPSGQDFLARILRKRAAEDILPNKSLRLIVELCGGVLRDLLSLARAAGEEAYTAGADRVETAHIESAADAFGRTLMLGLDPDEIEVLQRLRSKGTFVQTSDKDIALLVTRRVLEYTNGRTRYAAHPTIVPLLDQLSDKS